MSFFKKLFGLGNSGDAPSQNTGGTAPENYKGFIISAAPFEQEGAFQLCGIIAKDIDGERKEHRFIRADRLPSRDLAQSMALAKARQIIDHEGEALFYRTA